jgi:hypothetical protein
VQKRSSFFYLLEIEGVVYFKYEPILPGRYKKKGLTGSLKSAPFVDMDSNDRILAMSF